MISKEVFREHRTKLIIALSEPQVVKGMTHADIAKILGLKKQAVTKIIKVIYSVQNVAKRLILSCFRWIKINISRI